MKEKRHYKEHQKFMQDRFRDYEHLVSVVDEVISKLDKALYAKKVGPAAFYEYIGYAIKYKPYKNVDGELIPDYVFRKMYLC